MTEGKKNDAGKPRLSLLDRPFLEGMARVRDYGEKLHGFYNWRRGLSQSRLMDAAQRHLWAFIDGEDLDPETGELHLYHAACCLMFSARMLQDRPDLDDRYKPRPGPALTFEEYHKPRPNPFPVVSPEHAEEVRAIEALFRAEIEKVTGIPRVMVGAPEIPLTPEEEEGFNEMVRRRHSQGSGSTAAYSKTTKPSPYITSLQGEQSQ